MKKRADGRYVKKVTLSDGTKKYFYSNAKTEREATKDFNEQILKHEKELSNRMLFKTVADKWNSEYRLTISDLNYRKSVRCAYERTVDYFGDYSIEEITPVTVNTFYGFLIKKNYSKKTISSHKSVLNMIYQYAVLNGHIKYNPVPDIRLPANLPKKQRELPDSSDIKVVNSNYEGFAFLPYFLLYTGLRLSEALPLTYEDIDFKKKLIHINKHLLHDGNRPIIENKLKTENAKRDVVLLDRLADKIPKNKKGPVFCNADGSYLTKCQLKKRWDKWRKENSVSVTAHQLRHAYATMLFEAGVDVKDAQELMGHSDINLTRQIYTHIRTERKEQTLNKLNEFQF